MSQNGVLKISSWIWHYKQNPKCGKTSRFYYHDGLELYLDISRMRFDEELLANLKPKFDKAFADLAALYGRAIANTYENRRVGHYWLRDPEQEL